MAEKPALATPATAAQPVKPPSPPVVATAAAPEPSPEIRVADAQSHLLAHPDVAKLGGNEDVFYVWEFRNGETNTGPDIAITRLTKSYSIEKDRAKFALSHPHIVVDKAKGYQAFASIFAAQQEADRRSRAYSLRDPGRISAGDIFPGEANRILETGKPNEHPDIVGQ